MMPDALTELFRTLRLRGAVYYARDFSSPWGIRFPARPHAQFHVALGGSCHVEAAGQSLVLKENEVVLFPTGIPHLISDGGESVREGREVVQAIMAGGSPFPGEVPSVRLLSGHFEFDRQGKHPVITALPPLTHAALASEMDAGLFAALFPMLAAEAGSGRPGTQALMERLAEIFLVQLLRAHFRASSSHVGILGAMFDPKLGAALAAIHTRWHQPLSVDDLAKMAGMSRSAFAERFKRVTETSPIAYLAQWRLLKSRQLLEEDELSITQIAEACGHLSTEEFSRAFKRAFGVSPSKLRTPPAA